MLDACVSRENVRLSSNDLIYELKQYENIFTPSLTRLMDFPVPIKYSLSKHSNAQIKYAKI